MRETMPAWAMRPARGMGSASEVGMPWSGPAREPVDARWASRASAWFRADSWRNSVTKFVLLREILVSLACPLFFRHGPAPGFSLTS